MFVEITNNRIYWEFYTSLKQLCNTRSLEVYFFKVQNNTLTLCLKGIREKGSDDSGFLRCNVKDDPKMQCHY